MSPLGDLIRAGASPWVLGAVLVTEWWAIWFVLGRQFRTTSVLVLLTNGLTTGVLALLLYSETLGSGSLAFKATWMAQCLSFLVLGLCLAATEAAVLRGWMRLHRRSWNWDRYDLVVIFAVNFLGPALCWWRLS